MVGGGGEEVKKMLGGGFHQSVSWCAPARAVLASDRYVWSAIRRLKMDAQPQVGKVECRLLLLHFFHFAHPTGYRRTRPTGPMSSASPPINASIISNVILFQRSIRGQTA